MFALFDNGKQISKVHSTYAAALIEAYEKKLVVDYSADFIGDKSGRCLVDGVEIKQTKQEIEG